MTAPALLLAAREVRASGWAGSPDVRARRLSYLPEADLVPYAVDEDGAEPPYAVADAWTPPHELAVPQEVCDRLLAAVRTTPPMPSDNGTYYLEPKMSADDERAIVDRFAAANEAWWRLDLDRWPTGLKRYQPGERHPEHQDLHAGVAGRKLAGVVQLSQPEDYTGGNLIMRCAHERVRMPRTRGTLVAFPGWTVHEVEQVTRGERWVLCINGWGPPLR